MWQAIASAVSNLDVGATMAIVALATGVSERQARRDLQTTLERLRLPYGGFRDAAKRFRLRLALVLLSAPGASIGEVARAVGYRHGEALANAFAEVGLPPPGRVRLVLLGLMDGRDELAARKT
jgi:transcriptional regulator GlxA family with amidase domain